MKNLGNVLGWAALSLFALSVVVGLFGSTTTYYQCKYITKVTTQVADDSKYGTALYTMHYSDGTIGATSDIDNSGPNSADRGAACRTILNWGWPYNGTNRDIKNESVIWSKK